MKQLSNSILFELKNLGEDVKKHCERVSKLSYILAGECGFNNRSRYEAQVGAFLHDVGKINVSKEILYKKGPLTEDEMLEIKKHPVYGYIILNKYEKLRPYANFVLYHHEFTDGTGYFKLRGEEIPLQSRIITICDIFDSLCSDRPYRSAFSFNDAMEIIENDFKDKLDVMYLGRFKDIASKYYYYLYNNCSDDISIKEEF